MKRILFSAITLLAVSCGSKQAKFQVKVISREFTGVLEAVAKTDKELQPGDTVALYHGHMSYDGWEIVDGPATDTTRRLVSIAESGASNHRDTSVIFTHYRIGIVQ